MARGLDDVDKVMCGVLDSELDKRVFLARHQRQALHMKGPGEKIIGDDALDFIPPGFQEIQIPGQGSGTAGQVGHARRPVFIEHPLDHFRFHTRPGRIDKSQAIIRTKGISAGPRGELRNPVAAFSPENSCGRRIDSGTFNSLPVQFHPHDPAAVIRPSLQPDTAATV